MADRRRTAKDVFEMPDPVRTFIAQGVQTPPIADTLQSQVTDEPLASLAPPKNARIVEMGRARSPEPRTGNARTRAKSPSPSPVPTVPVERAYAKATVQKTIRFHPRLIAELDAYFREQMVNHDRPVSIQHVQNEALDLWLERNVRSRTP
jgi:hypothetical protein